MRKTSLIALISFAAGLILAAFIFVYYPQKQTSVALQDVPLSEELSSSLYASPRQQPTESLDFATIAERVSPAVVYIVAEKVERVRTIGFFDDSPFEDFWERFGFPRERGREQEQRSFSSGTGFFISQDGYILTNNHIVEKAVKVTVTSLQEKEYRAKIIGTDSETDMALIKVEDKNLPFARLGDSDTCKVGDWVLAIGNPLGLNHTVTAGIVSGKGRLIPGLDLPYQDFIQTDAAINRGNSGGPLINMEGDVIGMNTLIFSSTGGNIGIGFAISSKLANKIIPQLREEGKVVRGWLGVGVYPVTTDTLEILKVEEKKGAYISTIEAGSPADKAGLKRYDVIAAIHGQPIKDQYDLTFKIAETKPGSKIKLTIIREGKEQEVEVKVGEKASAEEKEAVASSGQEIGIKVRELTPRLASRYGYQIETGLIITEVKRYSEADRRGLEVGDVVTEANRQEIETVRDLEKIIEKAEPGDSILLRIRREKRGSSGDFMVTLRIPE